LPKTALLSFDSLFKAQGGLTEIADAPNALRFGFGLGQVRENQAREDGDNGNNDQEFNEGKSFPMGHLTTICMAQRYGLFQSGVNP
jgi:hypothetical protein